MFKQEYEDENHKKFLGQVQRLLVGLCQIFEYVLKILPYIFVGCFWNSLGKYRVYRDCKKLLL